MQNNLSKLFFHSISPLTFSDYLFSHFELIKLIIPKSSKGFFAISFQEFEIKPIHSWSSTLNKSFTKERLCLVKI